MAFLSAHIPFLIGAAGSLILLISMAAVSVTGFQYLRAMETTRARIRTEKSRDPQPRR